MLHIAILAPARHDTASAETFTSTDDAAGAGTATGATTKSEPDQRAASPLRRPRRRRNTTTGPIAAPGTEGGPKG